MAGPLARAVTSPPMQPRGTTFVLLGGVPGAGKTTLLHRVTARRPDVRTVDPDRLRERIAGRLPRGVPYRRYRFVVHTLNALVTLGLIMRGPARSQRPLVVHDPATRRWRRRLVARLARWRGWEPALLVIDVSRQEAVTGQHQRGRILAPRAFDRHWRRWQQQRPALARDAVDEPWSRILVVDRASAAPVLWHLLALTGGDRGSVEAARVR